MNKLTPKLGSFYREIKETERSLPPEAFLLFALTAIAKVTSLDRLKIYSRLVRGNSGKIFTNIYALLIAPSGSGKDLMYGLFKNISTPFFDEAKERYEKWRIAIVKDLSLDAQEQGMNKHDTKEYIRDNSPRKKVLFEIQNGTPEGLMDMRSSIGAANLGGLFIYHSEFAQVFENNKQETNLFLEVIKEGYEGNTGSKVTRHVEVLEEVRDVPMNMLAYTAPIDPNNEVSMNRFVSFLLKGYARRMHFCMPLKSKVEPFTFDEMLTNQERQSLLMEGFGYDLEEIYKSCKETLNNIVSMTEESDRILYEYKLNNVQEAEKMGLSNIEKARRAEVIDRYWRALKMSGLIAIYEHPEDKRVLDEDIRAAIWITEKLSDQLAEILSNDSVPEYKLIYNIMLDGKEYIRANFYGMYSELGITKNDMKKVLDESLPLIQSYAPTQGYILVKGKTPRGGGDTYKLEPIDGVNERLKEEATTIVDNQVDLSFSFYKSSTDFHGTKKEIDAQKKEIANNAKDYIPHTISWDKFHNVTSESGCYSASRFKTEYRKAANWKKGNNFIAIDIDKGWTIPEAMKFLDQFELRAMIATTASHTEKHHKFRIILPTPNEISCDSEIYKASMELLFEFFENRPDSNCKDVAHMFFATKKSKHQYTKGNRNINFDYFIKNARANIKKKEKEHLEKRKKKEGLSDAQVLDIKAIKEKVNILDLASSLGLEVKHKFAVCPFHNEKDASLRFYPESGTFYCFGCLKFGDQIDLYKELVGCDFRKALIDLSN